MASTPAGFSPTVDKLLSFEYGSASFSTGGSVPLVDASRAPPTLSFPGINSSSAHVLVMADLDAPNHANPIYGPFLHWLVAIPARQSVLSDAEDNASAVAPYVPPSPPAGSGKHRYVFLLLENPKAVFELPAAFQKLEPSNPMTRACFDIAKFIADGGFKPVAANWFTTEATDE